jgi:hypothetical protein
MSRMRFAVSGAVALLIIVAALVYTRQATAEEQAKPTAQAQTIQGLNAKADANFACNCSGGGITAGMAVLHCTCGTATCMAVRSTATPGDVAVSCK